MSGNINQSGSSGRITLECVCGKQLAAPAEHAGKRFKCPFCNQSVVVPAIEPQQKYEKRVRDDFQGLSKNTLAKLWLIVGAIVFGCIIFIAWYSRVLHQEKVTAANDRISQAVAAANKWMAGDSSLDENKVEQQLIDALQDRDATEKNSGEAVLQLVRIEQSQRRATAIFEDAKRQFADNRITEGIARLSEYIADPHATEKADAQRLHDEAKKVLSDELMLEMLIGMSDEQFRRVKASGSMSDDTIKIPPLVIARNKAVQRNLEKAIKQREEIEKDRIAKEKQREQDRLTVSSYRIPASTEKENIIYVSKAGDRNNRRADTDEDGDNRHSLVVEFDGKGTRAGKYYDVNGKPTEKVVTVDNRNVVSVDEYSLNFKNPGKAIVTVRLGDYVKTIRFHVIEIPVDPDASRDEVVETLGFPDYKKESGLEEYWGYKKYPGLALTWDYDLKVLTRKSE